MTQAKFPPGWNEARVQKVLAHYEAQSEGEAVAEDEAAFDNIAPANMALQRTAGEIPRFSHAFVAGCR